jgi:cytidyltransferase-like protein
MPYMDSEISVTYLRRLAKENLDQFKEEVNRFRNFILQSSEHIETKETQKGLGILLKRGYVDLVPLNCFYDNGKYVFYDQEFYEENYPANAIIFRAIEIIYAGDPEMEAILPRNYFYEKYGLKDNLELWYRMAVEFTTKLRNQRELRSFNEKFQRNMETIHTNRQRINYSAPEYQKIFVDIFRDAEKKKIILFGSGNFTKRFLAQFQKQYEIYAIVDNNQSKWGSRLEGIEILSPKIIEEIPKEERRIIICIKNYVAIVHQLQQMGVIDYCIYDTNAEYPRKQEVIPASIKVKDSPPKKYHTGYIAGVFDLFHIGHLNMFKRAKEQCDYLIVGVVTDEGVRKHKKTEPFIPFDERIELVRSCKYVDEAVEIPLNYGGTRDAYRMYHFDCQFSGSDYIDNPDWLGEKTFLKKQGADLVFFPYTEGTSSTKIKSMIERSLL